MTYLICGWWFFLKAEQAADCLNFEYCTCASHFQLSVNFLYLKADIGLCDVMPKDSFLILLFSFLLKSGFAGVYLFLKLII